MKRLLIVYHSQSGRTARLADAVCAGAADEPEVELRRLHAAEAGLQDLLWCDGLLLGTPENFGALSGMLKDFLDRTYYPAEGKVVGLPYAMFVSAGNDGRGAVRQLERIAIGYGWRQIAPALIARGELSTEHEAQARELGQTMAAGLAFGIF